MPVAFDNVSQCCMPMYFMLITKRSVIMILFKSRSDFVK